MQKKELGKHLEDGLLFYFFYGIGLSIYLNDYFMLLFFVLICWGLTILVYSSIEPLRITGISPFPSFRRVFWR